jgi:hypothetical protein
MGTNNRTTNNYGDLFVGKPLEFAQSSDRPVDNFRLYNYEFYAQDSWKVRRNFTLEYGLRAVYLPQNYEQKGLGVLFDPSAYVKGQGVFLNGDPTKPNGFKLAARGEIPKGVLPNVPMQFMPRLNFAWDIGGKGDLVVRAGAGLFYNRVQGNYDYYSSGQLPNTYSATVDTPWASPNGLSFSDLKNYDPFSSIANINISSRDKNSNDLPRIATMSFTIEKQLPWHNILTAAYVGTQARHLPQQINVNIVPLGTFLKGTIGNSDLSIPVNRAGLDASVLRQYRPFTAYNSVGFYDFTGTSSYHSMQATLSHQGKNFQYFATYTFGKALGTVATNETDGSAWADPIDTRHRSWGVLPFDRTHVFNLSYNYSFPKLARGSFNNAVTRGIFNGWQMSGITTFQSGIPIRLKFTGDIATANQAVAWYGSDAFNGTNAGASLGAVTPVYLGNPSLSGDTKLGNKMFDISKLAIPTFGSSGPAVPPFYLRTPSRSNFDVSFFKNFNISESKKIQFRTGLFNVFNQAYPTLTNVTATNLQGSDIFLALDTVCLRTVANVPNGIGGTVNGNICDPTGGFRFTDGRSGDRSDTLHNFGKIVNLHGRRIVEFALKFEFLNLDLAARQSSAREASGLSRRLVSLRRMRYHCAKSGRNPMRVNRAFIALAFCSMPWPAPAFAQDIEVDTKFKTADTNNAVIEGRVILPSGFSANRNVRITVRNSLSTLSTFYTNKQGEFHLNNLSEGIYYVQAEVDDRSLEPVIEKVSLGRGIVRKLTLELREKKTPVLSNPARVVSVAELRQVVPVAARKEYELGLKLVNKGDFTQAAEHFQQAISLYPDYLAARNDLGAQYLKLKRLDEAEKLFQGVIEEDPKNFNAKFNLGLVRIERKNYLEAISRIKTGKSN